MNAEPLLNRIAAVFAEQRLEAVMIGNAAAALHGAPVTTLDIDFMCTDARQQRYRVNVGHFQGTGRGFTLDVPER